MGKAAAKNGDSIKVMEQHQTTVGTNPPVPMPYEFTATIDGGLSGDVFIMGQAAAVRGSTAGGGPAHTPADSPGTTITPPPTNKDGEVARGSTTVLINRKGAARHGDKSTGCSDAVPPKTSGSVVVKNELSVTVLIGD